MKFNIDRLKGDIRHKMSQKRYEHTLGVMSMAELMAKRVMPERTDEVKCAALLHDIAKEFPLDRQISLAEADGYKLTDADKNTPAVIHSYAAPAAIKEQYPEYATKDILSSVFNHTVGSSDMSVFDEIIFLSDFIEEGRKYKSSEEVREFFLSEIVAADNTEKCIIALHRAVVMSIDRTIAHIKETNGFLNEKMIVTRNAVMEKYNK